MNAKKTKVMALNQPTPVQTETLDGTQLEQVEDYKYPGSMVSSTEKDLKIRKGMAWKICNKMSQI